MHNDHEEIVSRKTMENNCPEPPTNHHQPAIYAKNAQSLSQATGNALEKRARLKSFLEVEWPSTVRSSIPRGGDRDRHPP